MSGRTVSLLLLLTFAAAPRTGASQEMPENARQTAEGYWAGGMVEVHQVQALYDAGIRLIVSSVQLDDLALEECARVGVEQVHFRMGATFRRPRSFLNLIDGHRPSEIYVHCDHGADRAGAMLAMLLVMRSDWEPDHAMLAVASPDAKNIITLISALEGHGLSVSDAERRRYAGIYSGASNGGRGGLKTSGDRYINLVVTTLQAFESLGVSLDE